MKILKMTPRSPSRPDRFRRGILLFAAGLLFAVGTGVGDSRFFAGDAPKGPDSGSVEAVEAVGFPDVAEYRKRIDALAGECDAKQMTLEARITRGRVWSDPPNGFVIPKLPEKPRAALPEDATADQRKWFAELKKIEKDFGGRFLDQARRLAEDGKGLDAWRTAALGLFVDPDREELRRIFGYRLHEDQWRTLWEIKKREKGFIDHPQFGWITPEEAERSAKGAVESSPEKGGRAVEKRRIETEHFEIRTTVSLEEGAKLGRYLEDFHRVWNFFFYPMNLTEKEAAAVVLGKKTAATRRHKVVFFRNREEYLKVVLERDPTGSVSSGGYFADAETTFLYIPDPNNPDETSLDVMVAHETTHQLFAESRRAKPRNRRTFAGAGALSNFWITEAAATYMETFRRVKNGFQVGGLESYRFLRARERTEEAGGLLPIKTLSALGKKDFQHSAELPMLYTESAGLASFFLHADGGRFRDPFLETLFLVYRGEETPEILEHLTGESFELLDRSFRDYLQSTPFEEEVSRDEN